ncbi:MAG: pantoate--beta-alanine ligase [Gaiellales bacterium]|jgi:pantoate--beta-alanine ligase|nr:pantoate--beta-alanine ligase [Gaiellales bacterium]
MQIHSPSRTSAAVARTLPELTAALAGREDIALVPTMGALHAGHRALLQAARRSSATVVMSLFVNPAQFGPGEDFARYPRDEEADVAVASAEGADVVFAPGAHDVYPDGFVTAVDPGPLGGELEGRSRLGHFRGVATVVTRLFGLVRPRRAFFGEKDYQQLVIVRGVARDLALGVEVVGVPTVRDPDGLALSSRNSFLSAGERQRATTLHAALRAAGRLYAAGERDAQLLLDTARTRLAMEPDYLELRRRDDLGAYDPDRPAVLLVAARLGTTRLIDNLTLEDA